MKYAVLIVTWCIANTTTASDYKYGFKLETPLQQRYSTVVARSLDQDSYPTILSRSPSGGPSKSNQAHGSQGTTPRAQAPRTPNLDSSAKQARERSRSPTRSSGSVHSNNPAENNASIRPASPARSVTSGRHDSPARSNNSNRRGSSGQSRSPNTAQAPARSRSQSPANSGPRRANSGSVQSHRSGSSTSTGSSGPMNYPIGPNGEVPFPYNSIPLTTAAGRVNGPGIITKTSPFLGQEGGAVPQGLTGTVRVVNPYRSKVAGVARQGISLASAEGDTASARVRTGPNGYARLTATTPEGHEVKHVYANSFGKIRGQTTEAGLTPARATVQLVGEGTFGTRGRNIRRRALSRFDNWSVL